MQFQVGNKPYHKLTYALFYETRREGIEPRYTLGDQDRKEGDTTYPSLYLLYLQEEDLTEYSFALKYFDSWEHWEKISSTAWFKPYIDAWRTKLELKLKSEAIKAIIDESRLGGKNSYDAKKYIINKGWIDKTAEANRRGRPSKSEILAEASKQALANFQVDEVLSRLTEEDTLQ